MTRWDSIPGLPKAVEAWNCGGFVKARVENTDGTFLDEFTTNAESVARWRVNRMLGFHPNATITLTPEDSE